jgi:hypothetical protein
MKLTHKTKKGAKAATITAGAGEEMTLAKLNNERLFGIMSFSTALGLGGMFASLQALYLDASGFSFRLSPGTLAAFAMGSAAGLVYWKIVSHDGMDGKSRLGRAATILLAMAGVAAFLYPLRFVPAEKMREIAKGLATAVVALSLVGFMLRRLKRFFDADDNRMEGIESARAAH